MFKNNIKINNKKTNILERKKIKKIKPKMKKTSWFKNFIKNIFK